MEIRARLSITLTLMLLAGCSKSTVNISSGATEVASASQPMPTPTLTRIATKTNTPRTLKLKLTLDTPADLKVVQGQTVIKGQILSDRSSARERLATQRQVLLLRLEQLKQLKSSKSVTQGSTEVSYAEEHAKIDQAKLEVEQAQNAIAQFLADSPWTDYAREQLNQRSEKEKLAELNNILQQKKASLNLAIAQLQAAKEKHREELYKKQPHKDTSLEQAQINTQLSSVETELARLGVVRSPYGGTIKKIKWVGQTDQELVAELTITVGSNKETNSLNTKNPATSTPPAAPTPRPETTKSTDKPKPDRRENQTPNTNSRGQGFQPNWQVISVHDGDTMRVRQGEKVERIRMACIDAPELKQALGKESRDHLKSLVEQNRVTLKIVDTDRYGRRVAEVFVGGKLVQAEQVKSGMAYIYERYLNNCPDAAAVKQAEAIARSSRAGVWGGNYIKPWDYRRSQQ